MLIIIFASLILVFFVASYTSRYILPHLPELLDPKEDNASIHSQCNVCGDPSCGRQKITGEHQPWVGLDIPRDIDQALQDLFNKLLNEYVVTWYSRLTKDDAFLWEIRVRLRFACAVLLRRVLRVNVGEVICERLVPLYLRHVDDFAVASDGCQNKVDRVACVVQHLEERLHPAAHSRQTELDYLRAASRTLLSIGVSKQDLECRPVFFLLVELLAGWVLLSLSDTLCSPYVINNLLLLALSCERDPIPVLSTVKVQFLKSFASRPLVSCTSSLRPGLNTLLKEQKYLYQLIQYMKQLGVVNLLQFCLDVEDFNRRLLVPDIPHDNTLNKEAWEIYNSYIRPGAPDAVPCSPGIAEQFYQVLIRSGEDITRLQTSTPLFQAYEEAFCIIEQTYLPGFYQSDLYFELICPRQHVTAPKSRPPSLPGSPSRNQNPKGKEPLVTKISQKIQKLVSGTAVDSGLTIEAASDAIDLLDEIDLATDFEFRDMSGWKVHISSYFTEQDVNSRPYPVFNIRVRGDCEEEVWEVKRKLNDFYMLQSKLLEFHQQLPEELPMKKGLFSPRGEQFLESRKQVFESYLQRLVRSPDLCCSDVLHCFLRSPAEFQTVLRSPLSLSGLLRRSMEPMKLRKERGRHLDSLISSLFTSIEVPNPVWEGNVEREVMETKRDITRGIFGDNLASVLKKVSKWPRQPMRPVLRLTNAWDCLIFTLRKLLGCGSYIQRLVLLIKLVLGDAGRPIIHHLISRSINGALIPRLPNLIRLLQSAILTPSHKIHTDDEISNQQEQIIDNLTKPASVVVAKCVEMLAPKWKEGVGIALETLQYPALNKHLYYCLFDEVLRALFNEFSVPPNSKT